MVGGLSFANFLLFQDFKCFVHVGREPKRAGHAAPTGFTYLAFLGDGFGASSTGTFHELELALNTPLIYNGNLYSYIKFNHSLPVSTVATKSWSYVVGKDDISTIFNGERTYATSLFYLDSIVEGSVLFYFDMGAGNYADVSEGYYWTYDVSSVAFASGKLYGTNDDPALFSDVDRIDPGSYTFIRDLTPNTSG
jgi:hypothetical protein